MNAIKPPATEFQSTWLRCVEGMDLLIAMDGYAALTLANISRQTGLSEAFILRNFINLDNLLSMYDQLTVVQQMLKLKCQTDELH